VFSNWEHARYAALVNIEILSLVTLGFIFIASAFLLQFFSGPATKIIAQKLRELRKAQMMGKIRKSTRLNSSK
jgi:hypothetical protein